MADQLGLECQGGLLDRREEDGALGRTLDREYEAPVRGEEVLGKILPDALRLMRVDMRRRLAYA